MPAFVKGSVLPPIPFKVTEGMRYSLNVFIFDSKVEWPMETDPQESSFASTRLVTYVLPFQHALMSAVDYGPTYLLGARFYQPRFLYVNLYRFILMSLREAVVMNDLVLIFFYERVICVRLVSFILRGF